MICRVLIGHKKVEVDDDCWLREKIFHIKVEHQGRALNLITDNGSGINVVSQEIVTKLKLPVDKHPNPYKLTWVEDTSIMMKRE